MKLFSISIRYEEPMYSTLIVPAGSVEEAIKIMEEMTVNLLNVSLVQAVAADQVEGMTDMLPKIDELKSADVIPFKKDMN